MAGIKTQKDVNATYTSEKTIIDPYQTTNATQQTAYSIPISQNQGAFVTASFAAIQSDFSASAAGTTTAVFLRATGDVARTSTNTNTGLMTTVMGTFPGAEPSLDVVANTSTQSIDFKVTGKASTTINWNIDIQIKYSN